MEVMVRMFNPRTLQAAYSLAKLQDSLKNGPVAVGQMQGRGMGNKISGFQGKTVTKAIVLVTNIQEESTFKSNVGSATNRRPLSLTPKQLEEKKLKI